MSFFGYLAAGAADGFGKGLVGEANDMERRGAAMDLLREKQAGARDLATQRDQDRADRERENLLLRKELGGGGGGKGLNLFNLAMEADTPEKQSRLVETVRSFQGDDAANVIARQFGKGDMTTVNPSTGDVARYDRTLDENGQSAAAAPTSFVQRAQVDAEKGRVGLQRLLAMVQDPGKYDDFAKGEARALGTDAVRGAQADGGDAAMRKAGAVNMALEGKDRTGVSDGTQYDKAGVGASTTTAVGTSKINENNAQAGEASAHAKKYIAEADAEKAGGGKKGEKLSDLIRSTDADLVNIRTQLNALKGSMSPDAEAATRELRAREQEVIANKKRYVTELETRVLPKKDEPASAPAAGPVKISSETAYRALAKGTKFVAPDGSIRTKP